MQEQILRAIITVLDKTAEPLHQINARFAGLSAPLQNIGRHLSELSEESGLSKIGEHAAHAFEKVKGLGEGLLELAEPLAALGAVGSVAGLAEVAKATAEYGEQMKLASIATGLSTQQLAGWQYAAKLANIDADQMTKGLQYLNRNIAEAAMGRAKPVAQLFAAMGLHNAPGHLISTSQALHAVAVEVQHLVAHGNIQAATDLVGQLFGQRSGMALLPVFKEGPKAIEEALAAASKHGLAISAAQAKAGALFMDSFKGMESAVDGLRFAIGNRLFPVLTPMIQRMTDWIDANRDWIATNIEGGVHELADALASVDWNSVIGGLKEIAAAAKWAFNEVGGIKGVIIGLVGLKLAPLVLAFGELGGSIAVAAAKFVAFPVASFIIDFVKLVPAIDGVKGAMVALDLALDANPLVGIIAAATAFAALALEVYENWDEVKQLFSGSGGVGAVTSSGGQNYTVDPNTGQLVQLSAPASGAQNSAHTVTVDMTGVPQGTKVGTQTTRRGNSSLDMSVGYAMAP